MDRHQWHDDVDHDESDTESTISALSDDEDTCKQHLSPDWPAYRSLLLSRGYRLDSAQCVIEYYESYWANHPALPKKGCAEYQRAFTLHPEALCRDPGLPDNLFRGKRTPDGRRIMVKAVGLSSREVDITRRLSTPPLRDDPRNHCIPVVDIISVPSDNIALIVMEEWSSELIPDTPCCLSLFLRALRSCISHMVFMHEYRIAHLDISLRNLVTDYDGHYACIDYELSRCFLGVENPRIYTLRATEIPPELERGEPTDPFKADIWAMGVLMLRAGNLTNKLFPELLDIIKLLLHQDPRCRPSASTVLQAFDQVVTEIHPSRLKCELQLNTFDLSDCAYCSKSCFARP